MEKVLVTGCAGFIGSHLCERLLHSGQHVIGVDSFTTNYGRNVKERNLSFVRGHSNFHFINQDLLQVDLDALLDDATVVYHQAALPGVRTSWGTQFADYLTLNVLLTQRLLEVIKRKSNVRKFVYASSSSVYGGMSGPIDETGPTHPISPYGVTKLSAEQLCQLYAHVFGVPAVSLRYFTVFGPRQRPDMAIHRFIAAMLNNQPITVFGNGEQTRDFTYVDDIIAANLSAAESNSVGSVFNIGGGCRASVNDLIRMVEAYSGKTAMVQHLPEQPGDPKHTWADTGKARVELGYNPRFDIERGISLQVEDLKRLYGF